MNTPIYNIPARMFETYQGQRLIARASHPSEFVRYLSSADLDNVYYVQLLELNVEVEALLRWGESVPVDIVMENPSEQFPLLYNFSKLQEKHSVRISIPVKSGFGKAVKLALALKFAVKLVIGQPDAELVEELREVLDRYIHSATVAQSVEFFHSIFLFFYHREPASLWFIQEEDPDEFCFVSDEGEEVGSRRIAEFLRKDNPETLSESASKTIESEKNECEGCDFFECCRGYFKLPDADFSCEGIKALFGTLRETSDKMKTDLKSYAESKRGVLI